MDKKRTVLVLLNISLALTFSVCYAAESEILLPDMIVSENYKDIPTCFAEVRESAKVYANSKSKEVLDQLEHQSKLGGGATGIGCLALSLMVLGVDGGSLALGCIAVGTAVGSINYLSKSDSTTKEAMEVYNKVLQAYKVKGYEQCSSQQ